MTKCIDTVPQKGLPYLYQSQWTTVCVAAQLSTVINLLKKKTKNTEP